MVAALTQPAMTASHVDQLTAVQKNRLCDGLLVLARVWNDTFGKQQADLILNPKQVRSSFDQLFAFPYFGLRIMLFFSLRCSQRISTKHETHPGHDIIRRMGDIRRILQLDDTKELNLTSGFAPSNFETLPDIN